MPRPYSVYVLQTKYYTPIACYTMKHELVLHLKLYMSKGQDPGKKVPFYVSKFMDGRDGSSPVWTIEQFLKENE